MKKNMKKRTKKLASLLLALIMAFAMSVTAFAAQEGTLDGGSITINDAVEGQTYNAYQILYLESYNADAKAYTYMANSTWENWLKTQKDYVSIDDQGYVTWVKDADPAAFAKLAQAYAKKNNIDVDGTATCEEGSTSITISNLKLGYYLVDTTLGTLCSLDTTNPNVEMYEKNEAPTNVKTVEEDSTGNYGEKNDADIGQTVNFKSTITAQAGAENYVFHDKMSEGLTFGSVTGVTLNGKTVSTDDYTVKTEGLGDECTFHVEFTQAFCDTLKAEDKIVISYTATLNENAKIGDEGNPNKSWLDYGDDNHTTPSITTTYTWDVDVYKYANGENDTKTPLAGAKFTLSKNADGSQPIALVSKGNNVYRVAMEGDANTITEITTDSTGKFTIEGLDADTYYLTEIAAPAGYNKLSAPIKIVIGENGSTTVDNATVNVKQVEVLNQSGSELPSTGGMGTTIFYVLGGILLIGASVLLITKKRMSDMK